MWRIISLDGLGLCTNEDLCSDVSKLYLPIEKVSSEFFSGPHQDSYMHIIEQTQEQIVRLQIWHRTCMAWSVLSWKPCLNKVEGICVFKQEDMLMSIMSHDRVSLCIHCQCIVVCLYCYSLANALTVWDRLVSHTAGEFFGNLGRLSNLEELEIGRPFEFDACFIGHPPPLSLKPPGSAAAKFTGETEISGKLIRSFRFLVRVISNMSLPMTMKPQRDCSREMHHQAITFSK